MTGKVKWYNEGKGYGFITPTDGGKDVFVHHSGIAGPGFSTLVKGEEVKFDTEVTDKGTVAVSVERIKGEQE